MSMTLVDCLTGPPADHHDRCAFVLTKVDLLDEDERSEVVEVVGVVGDRLKDRGIGDPVLLLCAPGEALKEMTGPGTRGSGLRCRLSAARTENAWRSPGPLARV
jgi:hypothetical protein